MKLSVLNIPLKRTFLGEMMHSQRFMKNLKMISSPIWNKCNTYKRQVKFRANNESIRLTSGVFFGQKISITDVSQDSKYVAEDDV